MMLISLAFLLVAASRALAQGQLPSYADASFKEALTPEVQQLVEKLMNASGIPGMSLGIVHPDGHTEFGTWGSKSEVGDKVTKETSFGIASCSKAFAASAMGILMDDFSHGRNVTALPPGVSQFNWYTQVTDLLPGDWQLLDEWASLKGELRDIMSHQSGLPRHEFAWKPTDSPLDVARRMRYLRPAFELRERYHYNNQMYIVASQIISTYAGMPYTQFVKERIWDPLNMTSTTFNDTEAAESGLLSENWTSTGRRIPFWFPSSNLALAAAPAGVITNMIDMMRWTKTLLNGGVEPTENATIIPPAAFDEITTAQILIEGKSSRPSFSISGYGMGWVRGSYQGYELVSHEGGIPGVSSEVYMVPSANFGIVALANADLKQPALLSTIYRIIEDQLGLEHTASQSMADAILQPISPSSAPTPSNTSPPPLPLQSYAGDYFDAGYGNITLCAPSTTPSGACSAILEAYAPFDNVTDPRSTTLYAAIDSVWISNLRLRHQDENAFVMSGTYIFPRGFGADQTPFETSETAQTSANIEFVVAYGEGGVGRVVGFAINGLVGEVTDAQRRGGTVEETAEVWFDRVNG